MGKRHGDPGLFDIRLELPIKQKREYFLILAKVDNIACKSFSHHKISLQDLKSLQVKCKRERGVVMRLGEREFHGSQFEPDTLLPVFDSMDELDERALKLDS